MLPTLIDDIALTLLTDRESRPREKGKLWATDLGTQCLRKSWYTFNMPDVGEDFLPATLFKFKLGELFEDVTLDLVRKAGHKVTDEQKRVEVLLDNGWKVSGKIDAVIDDVVVDVKTTTPYGFKEMNGVFDETKDKFGYAWQVNFYHNLDGRDFAANPHLLLVDKAGGHFGLSEIKAKTKEEVVFRALEVTDAIDEALPPKRGLEAVPDGKSGNMKLPVYCSYCAYKNACYPELRGFAYSRGPVWLTHVAREPKAPEIIPSSEGVDNEQGT